MTKAALLKELAKFEDDDHIMFGDYAISYVPKITKICGKGQEYMPYYCVRDFGHVGDCRCSCKNVDFEPDNE